ncbi:hypothetical protein EIP91_003549 [Steccherinum ochraceum]|uniref:Uncharacterized protein n=1 Tax=Steccherinum ochraceum TaxID=92696 RepID=A0A4R0RGN7_9APHY|nr:hypothetical protein EIP91_003549 [Steccherinum ochraceum]
MATPNPSSNGHIRYTVRSSDVLADMRINKDSSTTHSYPPTPPNAAASPRLHAVTSAEVEAKLQQLAEASSSTAPLAVPSEPMASPSNMLSPSVARLRPSSQLITSAQITHFLLSPQILQQQPQQSVAPQSFFSRIAQALKSHTPARSSFSFDMCAIPPPSRGTSRASSSHSPLTPNTGTHLTSTSLSPSSPNPNSPQMLAPVPHPYPLVTFNDTTPVWTVGSTTGLLEVDEVGVRALGVDMSFYVAVALTYLEFLEEREGYLAAEAD